MKKNCRTWLTALALAAACGAAQSATPAAESSASAPEISASAPLRTAPPRAIKPGPRLLTPAEARDSTATTSDLQPREKITRQISIPLGKKPPPPPKTEADAAARSAARARGGVDDAEARCQAEADDVARQQCRDRLGGGVPKP